MPSTYAHYRFGAQLLPVVPSDVRRTIQRFRRMFDVGLHGPDIFFYLLPPASRKDLGHKYHYQSGQEFFQRVCRMVRLENSEAAQAYLYGLLGHYALDSACHPFIHELSDRDPSLHLRVETEFDRFLLESDGKTPACQQDLSPHIQLTPGECETVAKFYPGAATRIVESSVRNMARMVRVLSQPEGARKSVVQVGLKVLSRALPDMMIPSVVDPEISRFNEPLLSLYQQALANYPGLLAQIQSSLACTTTLDEAFSPIFG